MAFSPETRWLHPNYNWSSIGPVTLPIVTHTGASPTYVYPSLLFANDTEGIVRVMDLCVSNIGAVDDVLAIYIWRQSKVMPTAFPLPADRIVSGCPISGTTLKETWWYPGIIVLQPGDQLHATAGLVSSLSLFSNLLKEL